MNARTSRTARTHTTRVLPHLRRRDGIVEGPRQHTQRSDFQTAVSVGWRPTG